jgi:PAS domain S-box-containing protein
MTSPCAITTPPGRAFLAGGGETGAILRARDWTASPLGPPEAWPQALRHAVSLCLTAPAPVVIHWGPDFIVLYNDAAMPLIGDLHPAILGLPARDAFRQAWPVLGPQFAQVMRTGTGMIIERQRFDLMRRGSLEPTIWSYALSPIRDAHGATAGVMNMTQETTGLVQTEQRLRDSEAYLRLVLDNSVNGLYGVDRHGTTVFCNAVFLRMLGFAAEADALGRKLHDVIHHSHPDGTAYDVATCPIYQGAKTGAPAHVTGEHFYRLDGTSFPVEYWVRPITRDGEVQGAVCTFIDITEKLQAGKALNESETRFRLIADSAPVPMWVTAIGGKRAFVNRAYAAFLGVSYEDALVFDWRSILHPDDMPRILAEQAAYEKALLPFTLEARYRATDGAWRWMCSQSQPRWDPDGSHGGFIGVAYDVTASKQAAQELEMLNAHLEARVEARTRERDRAWKHSQDLQVVINGHGILLAANQAWFAILGWAPEDVVGRSYLDVIHAESHAVATAAWSIALQGDLPAVELLMRHRDGGTRWVSWVAAPANGLVYASGRNITAEKDAAAALDAAQEQLRQSQKMEAVGQLTGGIAHDFNNLLTGITGSLDVIQTRLAQGRLPEAERYIAAAQGAARRAASLTHRLLAFSRRQTLDPQVTSVTRLIAGMEELIRGTMGQAIILEFPRAGGIWPALVDRNQLENALLNLCINARDAMKDGGHLTIETGNIVLDPRGAREHGLPPGDYMRLRVTDTGTGMAPDTIKRAFDPFFTTKPAGQGTGLGLSMIYGFARQSGGAVHIQSALGHGTAMSIILPRHLGPDTPETGHAPSAAASRPGSGAVALVVDDEPTVRMLVVETLAELGYATLQAADARTARDILASDAPIDLLIADLTLPGGATGREIAETARQTRPALKILLITGYAENGAPDDTKRHPKTEMLLKPFTMDALTRRLLGLAGR